MKFLSKNFLRILIYGSPISAVILLIPSGDRRSWYDEGFGWPLFYGWRATDVLPKRFPSVTNWAAFGADLFVGLVGYLFLCVLCRYFYFRMKSRPNNKQSSI